MKKNLLFMALFCCVALAFTSCSKNDDEENQAQNTENPTDPNAQYFEEVKVESLDYTEAYEKSWNNYMQQVANLLYKDSRDLYDSWNEMYELNGVSYGDSYANLFKSHNNEIVKSNVECVEIITDAMFTIANEVGESKIGDPADTWAKGNKKEAVLKVESWYSWHSIDDYTNNIRSIRNAYYGKYFTEEEENAGTIAIQPNSMAEIMSKYSTNTHNQVVKAINDAINAIQSIPAPFRNYIAHPNVDVARTACANLGQILKTLKSRMTTNAEEHSDEIDEMINKYVDNVVLPTYKDLAEKNTSLLSAVTSFMRTPSDNGFKTLANAWMASRRPWETSEAFLFGPVDAKQLDPNMDSWPLDQEGIENNIKAGNFDNLNWSDTDSDDEIEAAQNLRGFHTLEYLIFKDGKARTIVK